MCGIAGLAGADARSIAHLPAMARALRHRGPEDEGFAIFAGERVLACGGPDTVPELELPPFPPDVPAATDVALAHRRLAIIDLTAAGHGPMATADGRFWITYNGEIFNYLELRAELLGRGHRFRTASDTEVLLAAWAEWGPRALDRFNGMWAFAIYDTRQRTLWAARDRFGVKPFHYHWDGRQLAFASEIKGLAAHPDLPRRPHEPTVLGFLVRGNLDEGDQTFWDGIQALPAGHLLQLEVPSRTLRVHRWYSLPEAQEQPGSAAQLRELLEDAVRLRLRSDVDVGTCLSGGLDSSSIVALTARLRGDHAPSRHRSFTIAYADAGLDESAHVDAVVAATGVENARTTATAEDLWRDLPALIRAQDEPIPSPGPYSHYRVMALAHESRMKVLLDGQGSDEVLAGYHYQYGPYLAEVAHREGWGAAWRAVLAARAATGRPLAFLLGLLAYHALPVPEALRAAALSRATTHGYLPIDLLAPAWAEQVGTVPGQRHRPQKSLRAERVANLTLTSLPALLRYEDRNSMAFSIEARTPFLDYRLVEAAMSWRARDLMEGGWTKAPLREAMKGLVPESVRLRRDKLGFPTPERRFLRELAPRVRALLADPQARVRGRVSADALDAWLAVDDEALARRRGLWRLLCVELWLRTF